MNFRNEIAQLNPLRDTVCASCRTAICNADWQCANISKSRRRSCWRKKKENINVTGYFNNRHLADFLIDVISQDSLTLSPNWGDIYFKRLLNALNGQSVTTSIERCH
ncbi:unnamed protein product, partial [Mesorhabditis belari]|uniref:Uncharacterized protein n=1 Tax=Mesorhabditis belari TaxID=2138241 RepID=A0AAF3J858_9BILA